MTTFVQALPFHPMTRVSLAQQKTRMNSVVLVGLRSKKIVAQADQLLSTGLACCGAASGAAL
ncbi:MAG: hypothetical protein K0U74_10255 [Alphaproteobacteria bacterium]|nr:hypothetical protein [Alphaproteobacteria bacterium]